MMSNIIKNIGRVLFVLIVQVSTIYFMLYLDNSNPLGFFLLFLPVTVPVTILLNLLVVNKIQAKLQQPSSRGAKILFALGIIMCIGLICFLITLLGIDELNMWVSLYLFLAFPSLLIEVIYRLITEIR